MADKGKLFIISGPSGSGKSSLVRKIIKDSDNFIKSISVTTRPERKNETNDRQYRFISNEEFEKLIQKDMLLEWASYSDYSYGTPKKFVINKLNEGKNVILVIEVQGAMQVIKKIKDAYLIFITTTSIKELEERLRKRGTDSLDEIEKRLKIAKKELDYKKYYNCIIVNNNYNDTLLNLKKVLNFGEGVSKIDEDTVC